MVKAVEQLCTVKAGKGKKKRLKCNFCNEVFSGITRIVLHLSAVTGVREELRQLLARKGLQRSGGLL